MGAIDRVYRFLCCITLGDATKNGPNVSVNTNCKYLLLLSKDQVLGPTAPSSAHTCWVGICQGARMRILSVTLKGNSRNRDISIILYSTAQVLHIVGYIVHIV